MKELLILYVANLILDYPLQGTFLAEFKAKNNYIQLKFNCKDPSIPVQLFNSSNDIKSHIKTLNVGGKDENITENFTFGFAGKYKVVIEFKDKLTSLKNLFSGCAQLSIVNFENFDSDEIVALCVCPLHTEDFTHIVNRHIELLRTASENGSRKIVIPGTC